MYKYLANVSLSEQTRLHLLFVCLFFFPPLGPKRKNVCLRFFSSKQVFFSNLRPTEGDSDHRKDSCKLIR